MRGARPPRLLDVRRLPVFLAAHDPDAAHLPLQEISRRSHELPADRGAPLAVWDSDPGRRARAVRALRARGYRAAFALHRAPGARREAVSGPARRRLWTANTWLRACWPQIEAALGARIAAGHARALDLACGTGRDAVWLAERGLHVEAVDRLPDALERAGDLAARCGVTLSLQRRDLERDPALPQGRYDLVTCFCFLHRPLLDAVPAALRPGGFACVRTFDRTERERSGRPRRARLVLEPGELRRRFATLEIVCEHTGPDERGRILQAILARRP